MKKTLLAILLLISAGCNTAPKQSASLGNLAGRFQCPGWSSGTTKAIPFVGENQFLEIHGIPVWIYISDNKNSHLYGNYKVKARVLDGLWRYESHFHKGQMHSQRVQYQYSPGRIYWETIVPKIVTKDGKVIPERRGKGKIWRNQEGLLVINTSYLKKPILCSPMDSL